MTITACELSPGVQTANYHDNLKFVGCHCHPTCKPQWQFNVV